MGEKSVCERALCPHRKMKGTQSLGMQSKTAAQGGLVCSTGCRLPQQRWVCVLIHFAARLTPAWKVL